MDKEGLKHFKEKLLKEKKEVLNALDHEEENGLRSSFREYYSELSLYDNHPADIASETFEKEMHFNLEENEKRILEDIDKAIGKIEEGTYGDCDVCGQPINLERLEIIPYTVLCLQCSKRESHLSLDEKIHTRPVEEEGLNYPFGRTFNDKSSVNGFDGEDSWQAVARYNKTDQKKMALDWYDNNMYDAKISGKVEDVDDISSEYYYEEDDDSEKKE